MDSPNKDIRPLRDRFTWRPQPRQAECLRAAGVLDWFLEDKPVVPALAPLLGYGGAAGGGKTDTLLALAVILCHAFKKISVTFFRREYEELEGAEGAILRSQEMFAGLNAKYHQTKHRWYFPETKSYIFFRHCHTERDKTNYQGQAFNVLLIDEATHFTWSIVDYLITRNRSTVLGLVPFAVMSANPGNVGHAWYSGLFDVHDNSGGEAGPHQQVKTRVTMNGKPENIYFIPARLEDNQILMERDPDYERKLNDRDETLRQALRYGNWQVFAGQAFRAWRRERHVIAPAMIPPSWPKWRAIDWGSRSPFCCLWFTRNPDSGRIYVYREIYGPGLTDRQQARLIREMTPPDEKIQITYADPSMWEEKNKDDITYSTASEYAAEKVYLTRADNNRIGGKRKVDRLLEELPDGRPGLQVFETCEHLIRTLPVMVYDDTHVEDVNTEQEDHAYDALRYGLTNYLLPAVEKKQAEDPLAAYGDYL